MKSHLMHSAESKAKLLPLIRDWRLVRTALVLVLSSLAYPALGVGKPAAATAAKNTTPPSAIKSSSGKHCLWRVVDAKAPIYLLGSIHRLRPTDYPLPSIIEQKIREAHQFYFEYDPRGDAELEKKLAAAAVLPKGVTLQQKLDPRTWSWLMQHAVGKDYSWTRMKAWAVAMFEVGYPVYERTSSAYGLDNYIIRKARQMGRPMHGLESVDDHVNVFAGMSDMESKVYLLETIVFAHQTDARYRESVADWRSGNTERLYQLEMPDISDAPGLNPRFLQRRNIRWIPKIEEAIASGTPTVIVAGAMHFAGPGNVLELLRARGHQIEQL